MKKILSAVSVVLLLTTLSSSLHAQDKFQSGFFLDNFSYAYRINPALMSEKSFFAIGTGNLEGGIASDIGVTSLLYPNSDGTALVTGLNSSVSAQEFLSGFKDNNAFSADASVNVFSFGKRRENKFFSFEINLHAGADASLPYDLFRFLKQGGDNAVLDLSDLKVSAKSYAEVALGGARSFADSRLIIGARVKGLVGIANADLSFDKATVATGTGAVVANLDGTARLACVPVTLYNDSEGNIAAKFDQTALKPSGYGAAVDLGVQWKPVSGLALTAGVNDFGGIKWTYNSLAKSVGSASFNGLENVDTDTDFNKELDGALEDFKDLVNLQAVDGSESEFASLAFTANLGARYRLPFYRRLSVGALGVYHFDSLAPYWDARAGVTITPLNGFSLTANYGRNTQGDVLGLASSISLLFLNAYFGLDTYVGNVGVYQIEGVKVPYFGGVPFPIDPFRFKFTFGVNIQLGKRWSI